MRIAPVSGDGDLDQARALFREYFDWLKTEHDIDIGYQGLEAELAGLPGCYAPPRGNIWLAWDENVAPGPQAAVACIALRPLEDGVCELKRMYLRAPYRGRGLGRQLGQVVIDEGRRLGYRLMRLDTASDLTIAQRLYASLGFRPAAPYYDAPPEIRKIVVFMELPLTPA